MGDSISSLDLGQEIDARLEDALLELGIVGFGPVALPILSGLVLNVPILLIGGIGAAKTMLARRLGRYVLGCEVFRVYDASKSLFEDVIGLPVPQALAAGEVRYAPTPISITTADGVLIDELSRANPAMQNKWLEVILSRTIMGLPLPRLRMVISAMNPTGLEGTYPLDPALAGRFPVVVTVPEVSDMNEEQRLRILRSRTHEEPSARALCALVQSGRDRLRELEEGEADSLARWANTVGSVLERNEAGLDGRRLGMLFRVSCAALAVGQAILGAPLRASEAGPLLLRTLRGALPFAALGEPVREPLLRAAHEAGMGSIQGRSWVGQFLQPRKAGPLARELVRLGNEICVETRLQAVTSLIEQAEDTSKTGEDRTEAIVGLCQVGRAVTRGELKLPPDEAHRVLRAAEHALSWSEEDANQLGKVLEECGLAHAFARGSGRRQLAVRVAYRALSESSSHSPYPHHPLAMPPFPPSPDFDELRELAREVEQSLERLSC